MPILDPSSKLRHAEVMMGGSQGTGHHQSRLYRWMAVILLDQFRRLHCIVEQRGPSDTCTAASSREDHQTLMALTRARALPLLEFDRHGKQSPKHDAVPEPPSSLGPESRYLSGRRVAILTFSESEQR